MKRQKKVEIIPDIALGKFVHGGQALAEYADGKKLLVWGGLPGEVVSVRITKKKRSYSEGIVSEVTIPSPERVQPRDPQSYLSTSPWQIVSWEEENQAKQQILEETFIRGGLPHSDWEKFYSTDQEYAYRNKMEFGFWGDEDGIHLAHFIRGSHGKQIVQGSALAHDVINSAARSLIAEINRYAQQTGLRASDLKTVVLRSSSDGEVVAALFTKKELDITEQNFRLPKGLKGLAVYYSEPKSPASVPTKLMQSFGESTITDTINNVSVTYSVLSFFQVNVPVFEHALARIQMLLRDLKSIDMYSGVGTIGLAVGSDILIESDDENAKMAKSNAAASNTTVLHAASESALDAITDTHGVIVDPPRAGLHKHLIARLLEVRPPKIVYLSCNPSTQVRDIELLSAPYKICFAQGYNFFPRTPHIESLVMLELRS